MNIIKRQVDGKPLTIKIEYPYLDEHTKKIINHLIPCITLPPEKEQSIGLFGRRHLDYLKQHHRVTYINLLTSGRLNTYLADIDRQAQ